MKLWPWLIVTIMVCALSLSMLMACDDDDDDDDATGDDDAAGCTVDDVCAYIVANSTWFANLDECLDLYLAECNDPDSFLDCACDCLAAAGSWEEFMDCEAGDPTDCWDMYCPQ